MIDFKKMLKELHDEEINEIFWNGVMN